VYKRQLIELVNGEQLKFTGVQRSRSNPDFIYFKGKSGSFDINFADYTNPEATNVMMDDAETEAYITLGKSAAELDPLVILGNYEETGNEAAFFGNWDLISNPATSASTPVNFMGISGTALSQEIVTMLISHTDSPIPTTINGADDFDTNIAAACAPAGLVIPTTEPVILDFTVPIIGNVGSGISAGGQTSMINGIEASWSLNYTSPIPLAGLSEMYLANDCNASLSGTWSWNERTGTTSVVN